MAQLLSLLLVTLALAGSLADEQLRGIGEASSSSRPGETKGKTPVLFSDCGCPDNVCSCTHNIANSVKNETELKTIEKVLLEQTKGINKVWKDNGAPKNLPCSCANGAQRCACHAVAAKSEDGKDSTMDETGRKAMEDALSLFHIHFHYHHFHIHIHIHVLARAGYGGCACQYEGCHCGYVLYGGRHGSL